MLRGVKKKIKMKSEGTIMMGIVFALAALVFVGCASATTHYVNPGESIQAVVNAADPDDTVIVRDGTYTENVDVNKRLTIQSENGSDNCIVQAANPNDHVFAITADYVNISGFTVKGATAFMKGGIYGEYVDHCTISNNNVSNANVGIYLHWSSSHNLIDNNVLSGNIGEYGVYIDRTGSHNEITNNTCTNVNCGINFHLSSNCKASNNTMLNNNVAIAFGYESSNNIITRNNMINSSYRGIIFDDGSSSNILYLNNFINNSQDAAFTGYGPLTNIWSSPEEITYTYKGNTYSNYTGNYWSNYIFEGNDTNGDGLGDTPYSMPESNNDAYPLMQPFEDYFMPIENIFDTGKPANPYPSIMGIHNGTIKPNQTINVSKLYTYPCTGTGGHTEYVKIWNSTDWNVTATWKGYTGDWHNISFDEPFTLKADEEYNYTIITGSYPQIHHTDALPTENDWINCTKFTDVNGKEYNDWIPAIRLE
jgi:parallel beta-helix repeat protein